MTNPNSPVARMKRGLLSRWSSEDYPGGNSRFQISLFGKDVVIFILLPVVSIILFKSCEGFTLGKKKSGSSQQSKTFRGESGKSQIIDFRSVSSPSAFAGISKRSPGALVKLKLLNVVEAYSNAPVHAQIIDPGLGDSLLGGTLIGDATADTNYERVTITFHYVRPPNRESMAVPIAARALSVDGTLGLIASKKEGFFARSAIDSSVVAAQGGQGGSTSDFKEVLLKALTAGLVQEFGATSQIEKNRSQVLTLQPSVIFFAELTDFFPGAGK